MCTKIQINAVLIYKSIRGGKLVLNIILRDVDRNDLIKSIQILVYMMHLEKPLDYNDIQFIDTLVRKIGLEDEGESVYKIDARSQLMLENSISQMKSVSCKGLFFVLSVASKIDKKRNLTKYIKMSYMKSFL